MRVVASMALLALGLPAARAQTPPRTAPAPEVAQAPASQKQGRVPAPSGAPAPAKGRVETAVEQPARTGEAQLRQRVEQLEEQLVDIQVVIGTLESLARNAGAPAPSMRAVSATTAGLGAEAARIDALETQIRALTAQLEQLSAQVRNGDGRLSGQGGLGVPPPAQREPMPRVTAPLAPPTAGGFGETIVTPGGGDQIARVIEDTTAPGLPPQGAIAAPGGDAGNPKQAYEVAYGYLLQQNYGAAESAFDDFLRRYPNDSLAGNAQYWLGESLFVRGQYKAAASAFLKGYQTYGRSAKAPDSLLKLAMSLDRLGQKDAACSSYSELSTRFPNAPAHVKTRAQTERQRIGC